MGFLVDSRTDRFLSACHGSSCFGPCVDGEKESSDPLHPKNATKILVNFLGPLALAAASEEAFSAGRRMGAEHELVLLSSAEGAGFPVKFAAHRSDSSNLFMHRASGERGKSAVLIRRVGLYWRMTEACSTIPSKWDGENTVEEGGAR